MGIPITGLSPSADSKWSFCEQQYFIGYNLKIESPGNQKAMMGTIVHKVMEILAKAKKALDSGSKIVEDEVLGAPLEIDMVQWLKPKVLSDSKIEQINLSRKDKKIYKNPCFLQSGHIRKGADFVEYIISLCYAWYSNKHTEFIWTSEQAKHVNNWSWMILEYKNGLYDPRLKKILHTEFNFELPIEAEWSKYEYIMPDGSFKDGHLRLRGIIDLVLDTGDNTCEVVDYKTGQRLDWSTGKIKDYASLQNDKQLLIYYYAISKLLKEMDSITLTIFYVRDGGPFSLCFEQSDLLKIEQHIQKQFTKIKNTKLPNLLSKNQTHFKCRFCDYSKIQKGGTNICKYVHEAIKSKGIEQVQKEFFEERKNAVLPAKD